MRNTKRFRFPALALLGLALAAASASAAENPDVSRLGQRLQALQVDPRYADVAAFERLQAQQAIAALAQAKRKQQPDALYVAERRVEIAETTARTALARRELDQAERNLGELRIEVSRRDAEAARAEAERLRMQMQIQAEEADRLRAAAAAEAQARVQAEVSLNLLAGEQTAKLSAAQRKEAQLARQEAELVSGLKLPASKFDNRGEVFTLGGASFESGLAKLSKAGQDSVAALAAYLQAVPKAKARIGGYGDAQTSGQRRAEAVRSALAAAGIPKSRLQAADQGKGSKARAVEIVVSP